MSVAAQPKNKKQFKSMSVEIKANESKREIEAYASTFGNVDLGGDLVIQGAFSKTINERWAGGQRNDIKVLWQHNHTMPLGLPIHLEEDSKGLYTVSKISKTDWGDRALQLAIDKVVDKMSIGYSVIKDEFTNDGYRKLQELKLFEYSLVTFPMNTDADVLGVKSLQDMAQLTNMLDEFGAKNFTDLYEKAGAVLSAKNKTLIENAIAALNELLAASEPDKNHSLPSNDSPLSVTDEELQEVLNAVKNFKFN